MTIDPLEGWHFIPASQKRHYFKGGRSLCGRFNNVGPTVSDTLSSSDSAHFYKLPAVRAEAADGLDPAAKYSWDTKRIDLTREEVCSSDHARHVQWCTTQENHRAQDY